MVTLKESPKNCLNYGQYHDYNRDYSHHNINWNPISDPICKNGGFWCEETINVYICTKCGEIRQTEWCSYPNLDPEGNKIKELI